MNRDLITYIDFVELMKREENNELSFEKALDHLSGNILYVTKDQLDDIYHALYTKIRLYNVVDGPSIFKRNNIRLYNIDYDLDDEDALFVISITLDYKVIRAIHINATIQKESVDNIDAFVEQYDNILTNKITLVDFIKFTSRKSYVFHKAFQDILLKDMEKIVDYFNKNHEQQFAYQVALNQKEKYILFYEVKNNKITNSYYFQWELEK